MTADLGRWASVTGAPLPPTVTLLEVLNAGGPAGLFLALLASPSSPRILAVDRDFWYLGVGDRDGAFRALEDATRGTIRTCPG